MSASERRIAELEQENRRLKHLLSAQMRSGDTLTMESGVNPAGKPFVQMRWQEQAGQLSPQEARDHALRMLEVADAADLDAAVIAGLIDEENGLGLSLDKAMAFLVLIREHRGGDAESSGRA